MGPAAACSAQLLRAAARTRWKERRRPEREALDEVDELLLRRYRVVVGIRGRWRRTGERERRAERRGLASGGALRGPGAAVGPVPAGNAGDNGDAWRRSARRYPLQMGMDGEMAGMLQLDDEA